MFNRILILCVGNICRSPLAEHLLARALPNVEVDSAGLRALIDYPADKTMQKIAQSYDIDLSRHRAKQVSSSLIKAADLTLVMDDQQLRYLKMEYAHLSGRVILLSHFSPPGLKGCNVEDPYKHDEAVFIACARHIASHIDAISKTLG